MTAARTEAQATGEAVVRERVLERLWRGMVAGAAVEMAVVMGGWQGLRVWGRTYMYECCGPAGVAGGGHGGEARGYCNDTGKGACRPVARPGARGCRGKRRMDN